MKPRAISGAGLGFRRELIPALKRGAPACIDMKKRSHGPARSVAAASSVASSMAAKACCSGCTTKGIEYSTEATTSPAKVKGSRPSPSACVSWPTGPCGPSSSSR